MLSKVFVVLLLFFSIAFTVMTVSALSQVTDWRDTAMKYDQHARVADANLRNLIAASAAELATARDNVNAHRAQIGDLEGQLTKKSGEVSEAKAQLAKLEADASHAEAMNRGLLNQLQSAENARAEYRKQRDELEKRNLDIERRNIDLSDRVNELTAQIAVLLEEKRQYEQQMNILSSENEKLSRSARKPALGAAFEAPSGAALAGVEALTPVSAVAVRGQVVEVADNLVTVSVGSADGVKKGMLFVVHRGDEYIGDVQISLVEPNRSAGTLTLRSTVAPAPGDRVQDASSMAAARR